MSLTLTLGGSSMTFVPLEAQNLSRSRFSCMLIPFSMCLLDSDEGKVKYSPLYGRGSEVTILVGGHFQSGMLPFEIASKKTWLGHIFFKLGDVTNSALFGGPTLPPPPPLRGSSMVIIPREAQNLSQSTFSCLLIPF